jgi:hypothetical protein
LEKLPDTEKTRRHDVDAHIAILGFGTAFWRDERERARVLQHLDTTISAAEDIEDLPAAARLRAFKGRYPATSA